jgi:hypothetical protein
MSVLSRRRFLGASVALGTVAAVDAFGVEPRWLDTPRIDVMVPDLPATLDGFRIVQLTDVHLDGIDYLEEAVRRAVRELQPNLVVLTGDVIDAPARLSTLAELVRGLGESGARVLATPGNWEHWGHVPLQELAQSYAGVGARLLVNATARIEGISLYGTDDALAGSIRWSGAPDSGPRVLLTHSPAVLDRVSGLHFDLSLSGHTHGGQVRLGNLAPVLPPGSGRFVAGLYDTPAGRAYVSRGIGTSVIPARFFCRPELPTFVLRRG